MVAAPDWVREAAAMWKPLPRLGGNAWAETYRQLGSDESRGREGPWRSLPWQRELLDAFADPSLDWLVILKCSQAGATELVRCAIGRWALLDPGDVLWVMATEDAARKAMARLHAMFRNTPVLRPLLSRKKHDTTLLEMRLVNGMRIVIGWAGSPQSLASEPFRYVVLDEVAKYAWMVKGEGSPVDLGKERVKWFGARGKVILLSSPKHDGDLIVTHHGAVLDRRVFAVPCPACGLVQPIEWERARWPGGSPKAAPTDDRERERLADKVGRERSAWIACAAAGCEGRLLPERAMWDERARWTQEEPADPSSRRAWHVPEFFQGTSTITTIATSWLRATSPVQQKDWTNNTLGTVTAGEGTGITAASILVRATHEPKVVPAWATTVLSTIDTQHDGYYLTVRAWARGQRSRGIDRGKVSSVEELLERAVHARFAVEGDPEADARVHRAAIDTGGGGAPDGSRTAAVYELVRRTPRLLAIKGVAELAAEEPVRDRKDALDGTWRESKVMVSGSQVPLPLFLLNRAYYADQLATLLAAPDRWEESRGIDATYAAHMASMQRVLVVTAQGSAQEWRSRSKHARHDYWDLGRYQVWLAGYARVEDRAAPAWPRKVRASRPRATGDGGDEWLIGR